MKSRVGLIIIVVMLSTITALSQSKAGFNYQGVVRDASKNVITDQVVGLRFSILNSSLISVYSETQSLTSNEIGLVNTTIGDSNPALFNDIDWGDDTYSLKVELDLGDDSSWEIEEIKELKYVPYAHYALSTGAFEGEIIVDNKGDLPNAENISFRSNGTQMSRIMSYTSDENNSMLTFSNMNAGAFQEMMRLGSTGNLGIGTTTPKAKLDVNGAITIKGYLPDDGWASDILSLGPVGGHFGSQGSWKSFWTWNGYRQTGTNDWVVGGAYDYTSSTLIALGDNGIEMSTADYGATGTYSAWPTLRMKITKEGRVGIGTNNPVGKLQIQGPAGWADEVPLFQVKNSDGVPVFAVYNNGVRILVEDDPDSKGRPRGGFSVAGFDRANKSYTPTYDFMRISPDSIRFNINNTDGAKGPRGGFAVGGFDRANKGPIDEDFMYITPNASGAGEHNTFMGYSAGHNSVLGSFPYGGLNTFIGYESGLTNSTGFGGVFIGWNAGHSNTTGAANVFIGANSGYNNTIGEKNTVLGADAGKNLSTGSNNVLLGYNVGNYQANYITGDDNVAIGTTFWHNTSGSNNVFIGNSAGIFNSTGNSNTMVGHFAGRYNNTGNFNVCLGNEAGYNLRGSNNVFLGYKAARSASSYNYKLVIEGNGGNYGITNSLIYGDFNSRDLEINAEVRIDGNSSDNYALVTDGGVHATRSFWAKKGAVTDGSWETVSDIRYKKEIEEIVNALSLIRSLNGVRFKYRADEFDEMGFSDKRHIGVIAQDVEKVLPELVSEDPDGYKAVAYDKLSAVLIQAVKEQQETIENLENELSEIKLMLSAILEKE